MKYYLAIDLGASSGRHIIGYKKGQEIILEEIYRFKTEMDNSKDGLVWNIPRFFKEIKNGIKLAFKKYPEIESLSIDTWGVDYVLMNGDKEIPPYYAYRNERNKNVTEIVHRIIPFDKLYKHTGIQFAPYNTIYQLCDDFIKGRLDNATDYQMLPSYFTYKLTGVKTHEYTEESTGSLLNAKTKQYDYEIIDKLGLPKKLFQNTQESGYIVGDLLPEIQKQVKGNCKVVLCASHDTGSAFEAVCVPDNAVIISSGTWSLLGIKSKEPIISDESLKANYTNEGGVGYIRFLKNIMGMWIANCIKKEVMYTQQFVDENINFVQYKVTFDVNDSSLVAPTSMKDAVMKLLEKNPPQNNLELISSVYRSMAVSYKKAIDELERITNKKYDSIYIIGGGAKNKYLNNLVKEYTGLEVVALPIEATALGNIKIQMKVSKEL
jgi:rhamnulokinase